jgi:hypothetical protein
MCTIALSVFRGAAFHFATTRLTTCFFGAICGRGPITSLITYRPLTPNRSKIVLYYTSAYEEDNADSPGLQEVVNANEVALTEDGTPLAWMQKSYEVGAIKGVTFSGAEHRLYYLNETIDRIIGAENISESLRIAPLLKAHVRE